LTLVGIVGLAVAASAQTNDMPETPIPDAAARARMEAARIQFMQSDTCRVLRSAMEAADRERFNAASEIPELKQLDVQIEALAAKMRDLKMKRMEMEKTFPALVEKQAASDKAHDDFRAAIMAVLREAEEKK
jgi:hypothetical protein